MRSLFLGLMATLLVGCIAEEAPKDIVNEQGEVVDDPTLLLNGLWDGQFDQAGTLRVLIYNGNVFAFDEATGYYGTVDLDDKTKLADITLEGYDFIDADTSAEQYVAGGLAEDYLLSGLLFSSSAENDTLVGDYETSTVGGSFSLTNDGTWEDNSALNAIDGQWLSTGYELYLTALSDRVTFKGISTDASGCTFNGAIRLLDKNQTLYQVEMTERKNCTEFNVVNAPG
ncbi:MAG: hypothetical protein KBT77_01150, partial [Thalassolituus oleivorans]